MNADFLRAFYYAVDLVPLVTGVLTAFVAVLGAFRSGVLRRLRIGSLELESADKVDVDRIRVELSAAQSGTPIPFEIEQLANYYALTLGQAKVSFWFSLVFASIGFLVIVGAAFLYQEGAIASASIKIASGVVIDAVAALFFVQSRRAQDSMSSFFEKLRSDRQFVEARKICDEIGSGEIKDRLKTILVLHYSGLDSKPMIEVLAGIQERPERGALPAHVVQLKEGAH